jgi:hypothetical protein
MLRRHLPYFTMLGLVVTAATATAQPPMKTPYEPQTRCSSLNVFGGVSTAESKAGGLAGGADSRVTPSGWTVLAAKPASQEPFTRGGPW